MRPARHTAGSRGGEAALLVAAPGERVGASGQTSAAVLLVLAGTRMACPRGPGSVLARRTPPFSTSTSPPLLGASNGQSRRRRPSGPGGVTLSSPVGHHCTVMSEPPGRRDSGLFGDLPVVEATNISHDARKRLIARARAEQAPVSALIFANDLDTLQTQNSAREDRLPRNAVGSYWAAMRDTCGTAARSSTHSSPTCAPPARPTLAEAGSAIISTPTSARTAPTPGSGTSHRRQARCRSAARRSRRRVLMDER